MCRRKVLLPQGRYSQKMDTYFCQRKCKQSFSMVTFLHLLLQGTLSMFITCLLGVSSLPSVGATLSWREFTFIQSKLGWLALLTATVHDGLLGWGFHTSHYDVCSLPSGAQVRRGRRFIIFLTDFFYPIP